MSHTHASSQLPSIINKKADHEILCLAVIPKTEYNSFPLYWLQVRADNHFNYNSLISALTEVLIDPLQEELWHIRLNEHTNWCERWQKLGFRWWAEKQFLPGVTDNLAHTVQEALQLKNITEHINVASGQGYLFRDQTIDDPSDTPQTIRSIEEKYKYKLFHPLTDKFEVHDLLSHSPIKPLTFPAVDLPVPPPVAQISLELKESELEQLSQKRLLALNISEMKTIQHYFNRNEIRQKRESIGLTKEPTDVELEILAQTWSEHCKHKIFNADIDFVMNSSNKADNQQRERIRSLYKTYIQAATDKLMPTRPDLLSVFTDNSGVVRWNDKWAVCFKVETHNSPSALEPYGGALTGILGVNRDILGTGLGAKPIFNTDVFCFVYPASELSDRPKLLPAKVIMDGVRKGVEDGGNKSGIPTVNGAIFFDNSYRAKPLVFCGSGGILPIEVGNKPGYGKYVKVGDTIAMVGGRVGKDGVHGATFSSESLHAGSPLSAVQIGDPFTQKRVLDFVLDARDQGLITGITDNGAGGLSSSVGEMARLTGGATIELNDIPIKYPGLADWEIVISESQERMTIATQNIGKLKQLGRLHHVEVTEIGKFNESGYFEVTRDGKPVALLDLDFLHDGLPNLKLTAEWTPPQSTTNIGPIPQDLNAVMLQLLSHPNICSREPIIRQYDHEVQGTSVIKPLMGTKQQAPCDAAVITPLLGDKAGLVISNGLCPRLSPYDPYLMAVCAVDEAIRNAVCVGADPKTISLLDNFCWPDPVDSTNNPRGKQMLAALVRACQGLYDAVLAFRTPLISGKDSMKNNFDDGVVRLSILPTLLISAIAKTPDIDSCISMEFKQPGDLVYLLSAGSLGFATSHYEEAQGWQSLHLPSFDLQQANQIYDRLHQAIKTGWVRSAHDASEGGIGVALAECAIGSGLGAEINGTALSNINCGLSKSFLESANIMDRPDLLLFGEGPCKIVATIAPEHISQWEASFSSSTCVKIGTVIAEPKLKISAATAKSKIQKQKPPIKFIVDLTVEQLASAWKTNLPFS